MSKKIILSLLGITLISLFLTIYQQQSSPPCFTTDEAAFGYNSYSLLKTGKDEYGTLLPLRLKSFGDYKLPLYSYLSVPFIALFGLNETGTRMLNVVVMTLFPLVVFFKTRELFKKDSVALIAAFLTSASLGLHLIGRQAHEGLLASFLLVLTTIFYIRLLKYNKLKDLLLFLIILGFALFSYHIGRILALFLLAYAVFFFWNKRSGKKTLAVLTLVTALFFIPDLLYRPERVKNLFFFNSIGYHLKIDELRGEGGSRLIYNKVTTSIPTVLNNYLVYFSPQFLVTDGDANKRFGFPGMGPITVIEYVALFVGLYYLFKNKEPLRFLILLFLLVSPITAAMSWAGTSLTRSIHLLIPTVIITSYGCNQLLHNMRSYKYIVTLLIIIAYFSSLFYNWDFYLSHYPKRSAVVRAWQCGNRELAQYVGENYNRFDNFYITRRNGEPYIFLLFYLRYSPSLYQKQANLSAPDEFGFGQVEQFDKFKFHFVYPPLQKTVLIGHPDEFPKDIEQTKIKKITVGTQEVFWIYETM